MTNNEPKLICPNCGSERISPNALHNFAPLDEQFMYSCEDCSEQFNPPKEGDEEVSDANQRTNIH